MTTHETINKAWGLDPEKVTLGVKAQQSLGLVTHKAASPLKTIGRWVSRAVKAVKREVRGAVALLTRPVLASAQHLRNRVVAWHLGKQLTNEFYREVVWTLKATWKMAKVNILWSTVIFFFLIPFFALSALLAGGVAGLTAFFSFALLLEIANQLILIVAFSFIYSFVVVSIFKATGISAREMALA